MNAMDFTLRQLEIAGQYKPETNHMDRPIRSIDQTSEDIRQIIADRPGATIEYIEHQIGMEKQSVRRHVRALVAKGQVKGTPGNNADRATKYRTAEP